MPNYACDCRILAYIKKISKHRSSTAEIKKKWVVFIFLLTVKAGVKAVEAELDCYVEGQLILIININCMKGKV